MNSPFSSSESLFSTDCIPEEDCTYATGFWAILGLYGLLYVCFFIFEMEWKLVVKDFSRWILLRLNIKTQKDFDEADEEESRGKTVIFLRHPCFVECEWADLVGSRDALPRPKFLNFHAVFWQKLVESLVGTSPLRIWGESEQARKHASEKSTLALKPRADVTRSPKQGYQWPDKKDSCPTKLKKKGFAPLWEI